MFDDGLLVSAVPGRVTGWLDEGRVLVNGRRGTSQIVRIYDWQGNLLGDPPVPEGWISGFSVVAPTRILVRPRNAIYDLETGAVVWGSFVTELNAVAGAFVVYGSQNQLFADPIPP